MDGITEAPTSPSGRGRGRGRRDSDGSSQPHNPHRGRGRGRGRGGRGRGRGGPGMPSQDNNIQANLGRPPGGSFGARLTEAAPQQPQDDTAGSTQQQLQATAAAATAGMQPIERKQSIGTEDSEVCFICASSIDHLSIAPCNHQTCHICSLRLRALYKTRACAHCRVSSTTPTHGQC